MSSLDKIEINICTRNKERLSSEYSTANVYSVCWVALCYVCVDKEYKSSQDERRWAGSELSSMVLGNPDETGQIPLANRALLGSCFPMTPAQTQASTVENGESPIGGPRVARRNNRAGLLWQCGSVACYFFFIPDMEPLGHYGV